MKKSVILELIIILVTSAFIAVSSALSSCTQNDGEIGHLFGLWTLNDFYTDDYHISGEQCDGYSIRFQSNVVQYVENLPYHDSRMFFGMWNLRSDSLFLNFPDVVSRSDFLLNGKLHEIDAEVDFPIASSIGFKINILSNSVLDISRTSVAGIEMRYIFKKLN